MQKTPRKVNMLNSISTRIVCPAPDVHHVRAEDGTLLTPPDTWALLPPGDPGLTRRVKAAGPTWTVIEKRGRKKFSQGVLAPVENIERARIELTQERATPGYAKRQEASAQRRKKTQAQFVDSFASEVLAFLRFAPPFEAIAQKMAQAITQHATPVGSGTVARTQRLTVDQKAEAAVIAWMRHQTTTYDHLSIPRTKGLRREIRRQLAEISRALLDVHRRGELHDARVCPLCKVWRDDLGVEIYSSLQ